MQTTLDIDELRTWIGRSETSTDLIVPGPARRLQATLDRDPTFATGDSLPAFWHYLYFNPEATASQLKDDGHEQLGRFLPPVALPRRMWASGRVDITRPLTIGETATKTSTIEDVTMTKGKSGQLCFVTVNHDVTVAGEACFSERQNIVYREMPAPGSPQPGGMPAPDDAAFETVVTPDPVMLFRYSALIFYGHRIHYDIDYTRDVEGYPGLVVHGPLTAALLVDLGLRNRADAALKSFEIRAMSPLFSPQPIHLEGRHDGEVTHTWARTPDGSLAMTVDLTFDTKTEET
ncbi:MAG: itaconyl-CoA hydratase [Anderseniella sp.]|nr:itaconyl-CoA hydratase [Anderseniella sp.]